MGSGYAPLLRDAFRRLASSKRTHADTIIYGTLVCDMAYKDTTARILGGTVALMRHQLIATPREYAKRLDMDRDTVRRVFERLERAGEIKIEAAEVHPTPARDKAPLLTPRNAPRVTVITVCNLDVYLVDETETTPLNAPQLAGDHPTTTPETAPEGKGTREQVTSNTGELGGAVAPLPLRLVSEDATVSGSTVKRKRASRLSARELVESYMPDDEMVAYALARGVDARALHAKWLQAMRDDDYRRKGGALVTNPKSSFRKWVDTQTEINARNTATPRASRQEEAHGYFERQYGNA